MATTTKSTPFKVQIMSDIHLEFFDKTDPSPQFAVKAPNLALLGDIGYPTHDIYKQFLLAQSERFQRVFVISGNHEYYQSELSDTDAAIEKVCALRPNLFFLQRKSMVLEEKEAPPIRVIGCTLWSQTPAKQMDRVSKQMNDYVMIGVKTSQGSKRKLTVADTNDMFATNIEFVRKEIKLAKDAGQIAVVLTHHAPTAHKTWGGLGFSTPLEHMFAPPVSLWAFGHTHLSSDQILGSTRIISNQLGYKNEKTNFTPEVVISVHGNGETTVAKTNDAAKMAKAQRKAATSTSNGLDTQQVLALRVKLADYAYRYRWSDCIQLISEYNWLANSVRPGPNPSGYTALHQAAYGNAPLDKVQKLIDLGCDITKKTTDGRTASDIASSKGFHQLAKFLTSGGVSEL